MYTRQPGIGWSSPRRITRINGKSTPVGKDTGRRRFRFIDPTTEADFSSASSLSRHTCILAYLLTYAFIPLYARVVLFPVASAVRFAYISQLGKCSVSPNTARAKLRSRKNKFIVLRIKTFKFIIFSAGRDFMFPLSSYLIVAIIAV